VNEVTEIGRSLVVRGEVRRGPKQSRPFHQVLTLRDGRILRMEDCRSQRQAMRHARRT
jgi:hypothetical protein